MQREGAAVSIAMRGLSALELWRNLALLEARSLDERQQRWELGDFTHDELPMMRASNVLARGRQHLPADYSLHVELSPAAAAIYGRPSCECDLLFKDAGLAVFYDSEDTHLSTRQQHNDALRHNALSASGITELSVTNSQIKSLRRMDALAAVVASACGKRHATAVRDYKVRQAKLRRKILGV